MFPVESWYLGHTLTESGRYLRLIDLPTPHPN